MASPQEPKFDPNAALREFNAYFGSLRKDYGEDAIRGAGFTPRDLSLLQASLRKLQMDPNATPEQHRQAYQQARDALAQRITTPLAASRPTPSAPSVGAPPEVEVRGVRPPDVVNAPMPEMSVRPVEAPRPEMPDTRALEAEKAAAEKAAAEEAVRIPIRKYVDPGPPTTVPSASDYIANADRIPPPGRPPKRQEQPTAEQLAAHQQALIDGQPFGTISGYWDPQIGAFRYKSAPRNAVTPVAPVPSATDYIASMVTPPRPVELPMPQPDVMPPTMLPMPMQPVGSPALLGDAPRPIDPSMVPSTAPGILPGITQQQPAAPSMNTQPGADFDRNVARQIFDSEFRTLREKYGDDGLRAAGLTPRTLASLQAPLTNVQKDNTISYDQSSAALENALKQLRGYNFGGAQPAAPMQPAAPAPLPAGAQQSPIPGYYRGGPVMRYR
jgi:hypothetical protein